MTAHAGPWPLVATIGEIVVEILALDRGTGFREALRLLGPFPSGAPAIFIDQVARLGHPCALVSRVGDDDFGRLNVDRLRKDGVDVSAVETDPDLATGSAFVRYREDGRRDFVFNIRGAACGRIGPSPAAAAVLARCGHLHVMGSSLFTPAVVALTLEALEQVRKCGGTVSFDPNVRPELLEAPGMRDAFAAVLARADLFLPSGAELGLFSNRADEREAVADLLDRGVGCVVVKDGARGARAYAEGQAVEQPAFPAEELDPTGAGDCFGATFVVARLRGLPLARCLALAAASGALAVMRQGPMEGVSDWPAIEGLAGRGP